MSRHPSSYLFQTHPNLVAELVDQSNVESISTKSTKKMLWHCSNGHEFVSTPARRVSGVGCPYCSGRLAIPGETDIATLRPDLAIHLVNKALASQLKPRSGACVEWECDFGHRFVDSPINVSRRETFCPECDRNGSKRLGRRPDTREKVLREPKVPEFIKVSRSSNRKTRNSSMLPQSLVDEMVDKSNATLSPNSHKKIEWVCASGHRWFAEVMSRARIGSGCPYCSGRLPIVGENDLATTHPDIARQLLRPELAKTVGAGSSKRFEWVCDKNPEHVWTAEVRARTGVGRAHPTGCPLCMNRGIRQSVRKMTLREASSPLLAEAVNPEEVGRYSLGSGAIVDWICNRHNKPYVWSAQIGKRVQGEGCPLCAGTIVVAGENDLATTDPALAAQLVDKAIGCVVSRGSERKVAWRCENGHEWVAPVYSRTAGNGCPICSHTVSAGERELYEFVRGLVGIENVQHNVHGILPGGMELDVVVPSRAFAFEFNGLYWHSIESGKPMSYHQDKFKMAADAGYRLVQIWEDDWANRRDVVMRMIASKLGCLDKLVDVAPQIDSSHTRRLYARKLSFEEISGTRARFFMLANHIQGPVSATRHFALIDGNDVVAVMSLRSPENNVRTARPDGVWEIQRYATSCVVVGGFSKLLSHAGRTLLSEEVCVRQWVTFSANDVSDGALYERCGFVVDHEVPPDYRYAGRLTGCVRKSKESFQRKRFRDDPNLAWDESWTEFRAARENGLWRIYDAGKVRWVKLVGC